MTQVQPRTDENVSQVVLFVVKPQRNHVLMTNQSPKSSNSGSKLGAASKRRHAATLCDLSYLMTWLSNDGDRESFGRGGDNNAQPGLVLKQSVWSRLEEPRRASQWSLTSFCRSVHHEAKHRSSFSLHAQSFYY